MTDPAGNSLPGAPEQTLNHAPDQKAPRPGVSGVISWIVIIACIALVVFINHKNANLRSARSPQILEPNVPLEMVARYAIGFSAVGKSSHAQPAIDPVSILILQLDATAKTFPDQLRVAVVAGELKGAPAALARVDAIGVNARDAELIEDVRSLRSIYSDGPDHLGSDARSRLLGRYGWYAHLSLGLGKTESDPDRRLAMIAARRTMIAMLIAGATMVMALVSGLVLLIVGLVRLADGQIFPAYHPARINTTPFLEAFALYLVLYGVVPVLILRHSPGRTSLGLGAYLVAGVLPVAIALSWPRIRGVSTAEWRYGLGWHLGKGLITEMFCGVVGYLAGLPILAAGALVTVFLSKLTGANTAHPIVNQAEGLGSALRLLLLASVFAPLAEESLFRGALFHHLRSRHGWLISSIGVSLLFAAMHPQGWAAVPTLGAIAMTFAAIREWRGTIVASATAHALNNGFIMVMLVMATN